MHYRPMIKPGLWKCPSIWLPQLPVFQSDSLALYGIRWPTLSVNLCARIHIALWAQPVRRELTCSQAPSTLGIRVLILSSSPCYHCYDYRAKLQPSLSEFGVNLGQCEYGNGCVRRCKANPRPHSSRRATWSDSFDAQVCPSPFEIPLDIYSFSYLRK